MNNHEVLTWLKKNPGVSPEYLAGVADISFSTLSSGLRGARWSKKTEDKIKRAVQTILSEKGRKAKAA